MAATNITMKDGIWRDHRYLLTACGEVTPFVFKNRRYRIENIMGFQQYPGTEVKYRYHEDCFRIRDEANDRIIAVPLMNHYFGTIMVVGEVAYLFALAYEEYEFWHGKRIVVSRSHDLISWTAPETVLEAAPGELLFNNSVTRADGKYVMLYEFRDDVEKYKFKFAESDDLKSWRKLPGAAFRDAGCTGAPALYYRAPYYYVTYLGYAEGRSGYVTKITRSMDLKTWELGLRPVLTPDYTHETDPLRYPGELECNAGDVEFLEVDGQTCAYWCGGNQKGVLDLQSAVFDGTLQELFELFFAR